MSFLAYVWLLGFLGMIGLLVAPIVPHLSLELCTYPKERISDEA